MSSDDVLEPEVKSQHDRRFLEMGEYEGIARIDAQTQQINQRIEAVHRRLLEAATGGRLTWCGDRIIRRTRLAADLDPCAFSQP